MSVLLSHKELETFCVPPAHCTLIIFQEQLFDLVVNGLYVLHQNADIQGYEYRMTRTNLLC